jgi:hypothetical protein
MARYVSVYRVIGRRPQGQVAARFKVAAIGPVAAQDKAEEWMRKSDPLITFNLLDIHKTNDMVVV